MGEDKYFKEELDTAVEQERAYRIRWIKDHLIRLKFTSSGFSSLAKLTKALLTHDCSTALPDDSTGSHVELEVGLLLRRLASDLRESVRAVQIKRAELVNQRQCQKAYFRELVKTYDAFIKKCRQTSNSFERELQNVKLHREGKPTNFLNFARRHMGIFNQKEYLLQALLRLREVSVASQKKYLRLEHSLYQYEEVKLKLLINNEVVQKNVYHLKLNRKKLQASVRTLEVGLQAIAQKSRELDIEKGVRAWLDDELCQIERTTLFSYFHLMAKRLRQVDLSRAERLALTRQSSAPRSKTLPAKRVLGSSLAQDVLSGSFLSEQLEAFS